jgi:hypothetical protein
MSRFEGTSAFEAIVPFFKNFKELVRTFSIQGRQYDGLFAIDGLCRRKGARAYRCNTSVPDA